MRMVHPEGVDGMIDAALMGDAVLGSIRDGGALVLVRDIPVTPVRGITAGAVFVSNHPDMPRGLAEIGRLAASGVLTLRVAQTYAPDQTADAHRRLEAGGTRGRLVITF
jgi:NADPH:quinone reductase-like Zn-dependent oxidoreductase